MQYTRKIDSEILTWSKTYRLFKDTKVLPKLDSYGISKKTILPKYHNNANKTSPVYFYNYGKLKKRRFTLATGAISAAM